MRGIAVLLILALTCGGAEERALKLAIVGFQMSSETHARAANAAEAAARAKGWSTTLLNSRGSIPESAAQIETLIQAHPDAIILCMTKPTELDAQFAAAQAAGIPIVTIASGSSPHTLFDIQANEYQVGSRIGSLYLLGLMNYRGAILAERFEGNLATRIRGRELDAVFDRKSSGEASPAAHSMARTGAWQEDVRAGHDRADGQRDRGQFQGRLGQLRRPGLRHRRPAAAGRHEEGRQSPWSAPMAARRALRRIRDPASLLVATVAVPFELHGRRRRSMPSTASWLQGASPSDSVVQGPYMLLPSVLVDAHNVPVAGAWPW